MDTEKTVLIVEDDIGLIDLLIERLEPLNYPIIYFQTAGKALDWLQNHRPFLILLDYSLPDVNGKDFIIELVNRENYIPPFIVTTGNGDERIAVEMMKLGVRDYVIKDSTFLDMLPIVVERVCNEIDKTNKLMQAETSLHEMNQFNQQIIQSAHEGIVVCDLEQRCKVWNPFMEELTGFKASSVIGKSPYDLFPFLKQEGMHHNIEKVLFEKQCSQTEFYFNIAETGKSGWVSDSIAPLYSASGSVIGAISMVRDITSQKQHEDSLKTLSRVVEQSPISIVITDVNGQIEYVNKKFSDITGYSNDEIVGENPSILQSDQSGTTDYKMLWNTIKSGEEWAGEFCNKKKNGETYWESALISPILNDQNEIIHFAGIKEDITEKKQMIADLIAAKEQAEESDRLKSAFLANMSHEIRTPMNGILGFAELLKKSDITENEHAKYIQVIEKSGNRMLNLINDLIDISKIESGLTEVFISEININELFEYIFDFFKPEIQNKGIKFSFINDLPKSCNSIHSDREKLTALLLNLVKNASKYTKHGFIEFGCQCSINNAIDFYVKDSGIGIPIDRHEAVFERFVQSDIADRQAYQGAGLGLAIVKGYLKLLGGEIKLISDVGKGSTFYFTLPINKKRISTF